jgi:hypothetical protein
MPVVPVLGRLRQENLEFSSRPGLNNEILYQKKKKSHSPDKMQSPKTVAILYFRNVPLKFRTGCCFHSSSTVMMGITNAIVHIRKNMVNIDLNRKTKPLLFMDEIILCLEH